jgi:hypothetical protein
LLLLVLGASGLDSGSSPYFFIYVGEQRYRSLTITKEPNPRQDSAYFFLVE